MQIYEIMRRETIILRLVVFIFIGAGLNSILLIFSIWEITRNPNPSFGEHQIPFITTSPELTAIYFTVGILFSLVTTLSFLPKRIVSTLYMQTVTATILLTIITTHYYIQNRPPLDFNFFANEMLIIMTFFMVLGGVGWLQGWIVKRIIGVNGSIEDIDYQTYRINSSYDNVSKVIKNRDFLVNNNFIIKGKYTDRVIIQTKFDAHQKHVLVLIPDPENVNFSILAITSYLIKYDWLRKPTTPTEREGTLGNIERLLQLDDKSTSFTLSHDDKVATNEAISQSLKITNSPFGELRNYSKRHSIVIGILVAIGIILTTVHFIDDKIITNDTLVNSIIFLVIVLIVDILPMIKEKIQLDKSN